MADISIDPNQSIGGIVYTKTITLTDAQIKALPTTAIEIIAAPDAGKVILPLYFFAHINAAVEYTNTDADTVGVIGWGDSSGTVMDALAYMRSNVFIVSGETRSFGGLLGRVSTNAYDLLEAADSHQDISAKAIVITSYNGGGNLTGGDAANTLKISISYTIIDI